MTGFIFLACVIICITGIVLCGMLLLSEKKIMQKEPVVFRPTLDNLFKEVKRCISERIEQKGAGSFFDTREREKRELAASRLRDAVIYSCLGDAPRREFLKDTIRDILQNELKLTDEMINLLIPFNNPERMSAEDKFEYLYELYSREYMFSVFARMAEDFNWDDKDRSELTEQDIDLAYDMCRLSSDHSDLMEVLTQRCYEHIYGHDCADILIMDDSIDGVSAGTGGRSRKEYNYLKEIMADPGETENVSCSYDILFCVFKGRLIRMKFLSFKSEENLKRVVRNIYRYNAGKVLSRKDPVVLGTFSDSSRIMVTRPPVSDGWTFFVRKFNNTMAADIRTLLVHPNSEVVIELLKCLIGAEFNCVISGNTGGGKTTLLKSLVGFMSPRYTIRVVEASFELNLNNLYPERNVVVMQERGDFTIYDAITATKKMDTDVLVVGEVNEPKLAGAYIQVAQSGSKMALTTLHHETTKSLIDYLRNALVSEVGISDVRVAEEQVVSVLNFDIHMVHDEKGNHYIERITEIIPARYETDGRVAGSYQCVNIVNFDREKMEYHSGGNLSYSATEKIAAYLGNERATKLLEALREIATVEVVGRRTTGRRAVGW